MADKMKLVFRIKRIFDDTYRGLVEAGRPTEPAMREAERQLSKLYAGADVAGVVQVWEREAKNG